MSRRTLTDEQWHRIEGHLPGRIGTPGRSGVDNRLFVDAILWMAGNAARWRDLPDVFGKWTAVHARFWMINLIKISGGVTVESRPVLPTYNVAELLGDTVRTVETTYAQACSEHPASSTRDR